MRGGERRRDRQAVAGDPTFHCTNGVSPTLRNPTFDFTLAAGISNHHPTLSVTTKFTSSADYTWDWLYSLDDKVNTKMTSTVDDLVRNSADTINQQFESLIKDTIKKVNDEDVDDFISVAFIDGLVRVVYTPSCVNGVCSCTPDCTGRQCGTDAHCGVSCGTCAGGAACNNYQCPCVPITRCTGVMCGTVSNGCGGTLACPACKCTPSCTGKRCGASDGCGGSCSGTCAKAGYYCSDDGSGVKLCTRGD